MSSHIQIGEWDLWDRKGSDRHRRDPWQRHHPRLVTCCSWKYDVTPHYTKTTVKVTSCTSEAALTKLSYVLGKESWGLNERRWLLILIFQRQRESGEMLLIPRRAMHLSLRGEMTVQFEAINPRTQELNFNKVGIRRPDWSINLGAHVEPDHIHLVLRSTSWPWWRRWWRPCTSLARRRWKV